MKEEIKQSIEIELHRRNRSIRNHNAIDKFLEVFIPPIYLLKDILTGSKKAIEYEKQLLTINKILNLVILIDQKLTQPQAKRVGILNTGKNNSYIDCSFIGLDIGIQDEGLETLIRGCDFS